MIYHLAIILISVFQAANPGVPEQRVPFKKLHNRHLGSNQQRMMLAVKSDRQWRALITKISQSRRKNVSGLPAGFFRNRMIIAVFQGRRPSSGYDIRITRLIETKEALKVYVEDIAVKGECAVQDAENTAFDIVETRRTNKKIIFEVIERFPDCKDLKPR